MDDMLVDYRRRCVRHLDTFSVIRYGMTAAEADDPMSTIEYLALPAPYAALSRGGRRPGNPIEEEWKRRRHYFNKRIMTDEERQVGQVQAARAKYGPPRFPGDRDDGGVVARDGAGGAYRIKEAEAAAGSAGRGDRGADRTDGEEEVTT